MPIQTKIDPSSGRLTIQRDSAPASRRGFQHLFSEFLTSDWVLGTEDSNASLRPALERSRNIARRLEESNPYAMRWLTEWVGNIVGPKGFRLESRVERKNGNADNAMRDAIEAEWREFSCYGNCTTEGNHTLAELDQMAERAVARDGECFLVLYPGWDNESRFAVRLFESDWIDHEFNDPDRNIFMGIEYGRGGKPIAYHFRESHPGSQWANRASEYRRVAADRVIHRFNRVRPDQSRGISMIVGAVTALRHLERYEEAELVAARLHACMGIHFKEDSPEQFSGEELSDGSRRKKMTPGSISYGPEAPTVLTPAHPNGNYPEFRKGILRGAAAGLNASYNTIAADLEGVNYSSLREGKLNERDVYMAFQERAIAQGHRRIFEEWLKIRLLSGAFEGRGIADFKRMRAAHIQGRRWDWVDPMKDAQGLQLMLQMRLKDPITAAMERGDDFDALCKRWKEAQKIADANGVSLDAVTASMGVGKAPAKKEDSKDGEDDSEDDGAQPSRLLALNGNCINGR